MVVESAIYRTTRTRTDALPALPAASIARRVPGWIPRRTCRSDQRQSSRPPARRSRRLPSIQSSVCATVPPRSAAAARTVVRRRRWACRPGEAIATSGAEVSPGGRVTLFVIGSPAGGMLVPGGSVGGCTTGDGGGDGTVTPTVSDDALLPAAS